MEAVVVQEVHAVVLNGIWTSTSSSPRRVASAQEARAN
jgi:hypothetical protein